MESNYFQIVFHAKLAMRMKADVMHHINLNGSAPTGKGGMMADREKVIKAIECCIANHTRCFDDNDKLCPYFTTKVYMCETELLKDALALLKEHNNCENCAIAIEDRQPVVRCKDCIHWDKGHTEECDNLDSVCFHNGWCRPDWFCADGERKENDG